MIVNDRADMTPDLTEEALRHVHLRYRLATAVTDACGVQVQRQAPELRGESTENDLS
ncbi:hypothetical protein [Candidatus Protofrankia californiensis]|uniref:hypothetical protein n=1 Tax=Candidatus Protofrankia californiensis TaxID=1839754 RepID=UPI0013EAF729|nr:hypothetical protein [Candidatus Protofrankia californiensis]